MNMKPQKGFLDPPAFARLRARPLKFRPRSNGGRKSEVRVLASSWNSIIQIDHWEHEDGIGVGIGNQTKINY